jgi:hypothetical protein
MFVPFSVPVFGTIEEIMSDSGQCVQFRTGNETPQVTISIACDFVLVRGAVNPVPLSDFGLPAFWRSPE